MNISTSPLKLTLEACNWLLVIAGLNDSSLRGQVSVIINHSVVASRGRYIAEIKKNIPDSLKFEEVFRTLRCGQRPLMMRKVDYSSRALEDAVDIRVSSVKISEEVCDWLRAISTLRRQPMRTLLSEILQQWLLTDGRAIYTESVKYIAMKHGRDFEDCFRLLVEGIYPGKRD